MRQFVPNSCLLLSHSIFREKLSFPFLFLVPHDLQPMCLYRVNEFSGCLSRVQRQGYLQNSVTFVVHNAIWGGLQFYRLRML